MPEVWLRMVTVISTFAGCGGSSLGYKLAGYNELLAIEWDTNAVETFKLNFPEVPVWQKDINLVTIEEILAFCNLQPGGLDVLDGSPPCQGFSTAGKRQVTDPRNDLFLQYVRLLRGLQPQVFVMENVSGMVKGAMKGKFKEIIITLKAAGYNVKCRLMNSMYYGVPQSRQRLIFIGVRNDLKIEPSHPKPQSKIITVREALEGLINPPDELKAAYDIPNYIKPVLRTIKHGENGEKYKRGSYFNLKRTHWTRPSFTILKTPDTYHPFESRFLTKSELKRIASFPDDFQFIGGLRDIYNRIGNSVPPFFMKAIAEHIKNQILSGISQ